MYHQNYLGTAGHRANIPSYLPQPMHLSMQQPMHAMPPLQPMVGIVPPPPMAPNAVAYPYQMAQMQPQPQPQMQPQPQLQTQMQPQMQLQPQLQPQMQPQMQPASYQPAAGAPQTSGGINPVLEYELSHMSTFLSWCSFGMLKQARNPTKEFESLVNSVLFATRLPKSTIIIALEYMNQRFSSKSVDTLSESDIFIKLIVSLILGNKFNDDNTFTNRSWCGATGLQITTLNEEERMWLKEINWQLNVVPFESNIITLEECWKTWMEKYTQDIPSSPSSPVSAYHQSLPSSPVSYNYYSSPGTVYNTSPLKYSDSIWANSQLAQMPSIWTYNYPGKLNSNFVGYSNPYYFNMTPC